MIVHVIRTDGTEEDHKLLDDPRLAIAAIERLIRASCTDTVNLRDGRVMFVDDDGWECRSEQRPYGVEMVPVKPRHPINPKATALYHGVCYPGTTHQIVGDVAIVNDADFA
jgi:hypothetical protein